MAGLNKQSDWEEYQENYSGIQNIQAQRQQNLANAKLQNMAANEQTNTLEQASGVMLDAMRPAQLNSTTQGILGKYGVQRPQTTRSQSTQRVGGNTTIINNNTTTYNTVSSDYGGPVQGRPLAFKQQEAGISKFKLWLDNLFSRQKAETARRDREYEKRERALLKEQNKLGRKLEGIGASIGKALDPRKNGQQGQLKTLLTMLGIGTLAKNFDKVLDKVEDLGGVFKYFGLSDGKFSIKGSEFEEDVVKGLGGNPGESIAFALKELLVGDDGIFGRIRDGVDILLRERADAIRSIKKPKHIGLNNIGDAISYVGDVLAAAVGGAKFAANSAANDILSKNEAEGHYGRTYNRHTKDISSAFNGAIRDKDNKVVRNTSMGDLGAYRSDKEDTMLDDSDFTSSGRLVNNTSSSYVQGKQINMLMKEANTGQVHTTNIMSGFQRLKESASSHGTTLVDESFFDSLSELGVGKDGEDVKKKLGIDSEKGRIVYRYVSTKKSLDEWESLQNAWAKTKGLVGGAIGGAYGTIVGFAGGGLVGAASGAVTGSSIGKAVLGGSTQDRVVRMAPKEMPLSEDDIVLYDKNHKELESTGYLITPEIINKIEQFIGKDFSFDVKSTDSMKKMDDLLTNIKKKSLEKRYGKDSRTYKRLESSLHSDMTSEAYSESLAKIKMGEERHTQTEQELEELKNREDRVYNSAIKYNARTHRNISNALGEAASPELTDFIYKSQEFINNAASRESRGKCGRAVKRALAFGGMTGFDSNGMHGYVYESWLPSHGYAEVEHWNQASSDVNGDLETIAKPGDIVVVGPKRSHEYGHVAMFTTKGWVSDFKQGTPLGLSNPGEYGDVTLFRPTNEVLNFLDKRNVVEKAKDVANNVKGYFSKGENEGEPGGETPELVKEAEESTTGSAILGSNSYTTSDFTVSGGYNTGEFNLASGSSPLATSFNSFASSESHEESLSNIEQLMSDATIKLDAIARYIKITALAGSATADNTASTKDGVAAVAQIEASKKEEKPTAPYKDYTNGNYPMNGITM